MYKMQYRSRDPPSQNANLLQIQSRHGKQIGRATGSRIISKKSIQAKAEIRKYAKDFGGSLTDTDVIRLLGISRNTYYKYKRELLAEEQG